MERNLTEALLRQLTSALVDVAGKKEPYQEQKWDPHHHCLRNAGICCHPPPRTWSGKPHLDQALLGTTVKNVPRHSNRFENLERITEQTLAQARRPLKDFYTLVKQWLPKPLRSSTEANLSVNGGNDSVNLGHIKSTVPHEFRYWRLLFGEPELLIPIFEDDLEVINFMAWSRTPEAQPLVDQITAPGAGISTGRKIEAVQYKFAAITSDRVIDTGNTYGIRINFAQYWYALESTATKWSTVNLGSGAQCLAAHSAWGTMRIWAENGLLLLSFLPVYRAPDPALWGRGLGRVGVIRMIWIEELQSPRAQRVAFHLMQSQLAVLESAVVQVVAAIRAHTPKCSFNDDYIRRRSTPELFNKDDKAAWRVKQLELRCQAWILGLESGTLLVDDAGDSRSRGSPDHRIVMEAFSIWKDVLSSPGSKQLHACLAMLSEPGSTAPAAEAATSADINHYLPSPAHRCDICDVLEPIFCGKLREHSDLTRLILCDAQIPARQQKEWKEHVLLSCFEMLHRIGRCCEFGRIIPEIAESIRPWDWQTAWLV
ncbi:hypothetical protein A1Q2_00374 [Trichosporon asahii var. asahii CBS 8904]|uniref:Uncharacterized protein n=1 Tax=Trichosporon asahii var. asahii (strain CBS 8904) TaxID=1220162 RepID=K1VXP5_TRIAC|nr:hypothetical protein A1Q2_00374 [Trichosporon asahii var. asahii CBS 8904]